MPKKASGKWYAQAIFELALEKNALESCQQGLEKLTRLMEDESLLALLENPKLPFEAKETLLREGLGETHPYISNIALLLVSKHEPILIGDIFKQYQILLDAHRGIEHAEVTTALSLDEKDVEMISDRINKIIGRKVALDLQVDSSLIGGFIARIGDTLIDGSVRQSLDSLGKNLLEVDKT